MRTLHLFAGAGGGLYSDLLLGHTPVCAVEWDAYACAVLRERAADGWFPGLHVHEGDVRLFDPSAWAGRVDCVAAGFPCQDISVAGKGAGLAGERSGLWSEVRRTIAVIRPREVFLENSPAIVGRGLDRVLADLAALGYDARWCVLGADDVGAPHIRKRWWCLAWSADSDGGRCEGERQPEHGEQFGSPGRQPDGLRERRRGNRSDLSDADSNAIRNEPGRSEARSWTDSRLVGHDGTAQFMADAEGIRRREGWTEPARIQGRPDASLGGVSEFPNGWWSTEPDVGRVAHGVAARKHRLHGLGNGQVPIAAAAARILLGGRVSA